MSDDAAADCPIFAGICHVGVLCMDLVSAMSDGRKLQCIAIATFLVISLSTDELVNIAAV